MFNMNVSCPVIDLLTFHTDHDPHLDACPFACDVIHHHPQHYEFVLRARWVFLDKLTCDANFAMSCASGHTHPGLRRSDVCYDLLPGGLSGSPVTSLEVQTGETTPRRVSPENCGLVASRWGDVRPQGPARRFYLVVIFPEETTQAVLEGGVELVEAIPTKILEQAQHHRIDPRNWSDAPDDSPLAILDVSRPVKVQFNGMTRLALGGDDVEFLRDNDFSWLPVACKTLNIYDVEISDADGPVCHRTLRSQTCWTRQAHPHCALDDRDRARTFMFSMLRLCREPEETGTETIPAAPPEIWWIILGNLKFDQPVKVPVLTKFRD